MNRDGDGFTLKWRIADEYGVIDEADPTLALLLGDVDPLDEPGSGVGNAAYASDDDGYGIRSLTTRPARTEWDSPTLDVVVP